MAFLSTKKENADERSCGNIVLVTVPDKFYELVRRTGDMYLFSQQTWKKVYGVPFNYVDITAQGYDNMVANDQITKYRNARTLEEEISSYMEIWPAHY